MNAGLIAVEAFHYCFAAGCQAEALPAAAYPIVFGLRPLLNRSELKSRAQPNEVRELIMAGQSLRLTSGGKAVQRVAPLLARKE